LFAHPFITDSFIAIVAHGVNVCIHSIAPCVDVVFALQTIATYWGISQYDFYDIQVDYGVYERYRDSAALTVNNPTDVFITGISDQTGRRPKIDQSYPGISGWALTGPWRISVTNLDFINSPSDGM
jgi:hypothetical protein